jgi:TonB family protein
MRGLLLFVPLALAGTACASAPPTQQQDTPAPFRGSPLARGIRDVIAANRQDIVDCYNKRLETSPGLHGGVTVKFTIAADGTVPEAAVAKNTVQDAELGDCMVARMKTWTFPQPQDGGIIRVTYPFTFKPVPQAPPPPDAGPR